MDRRGVEGSTVVDESTCAVGCWMVGAAGCGEMGGSTRGSGAWELASIRMVGLVG